MAVDPETPNSREEQYLARAAGQEVAIPECPWSRKEAYLAEIIDRLDNGGGGGGADVVQNPGQSVVNVMSQMATTNYAIGREETKTIRVADWIASSNYPFTHSATVELTTPIVDHATEVELVNDDAIDFATYGFSINYVDYPDVQILALAIPDDPVTLKFKVKGY